MHAIWNSLSRIMNMHLKIHYVNISLNNIFIRFQFENRISLDVSRFAKCTYLTFRFLNVFGWKLFLKDFLLFLSFLFIKKFSVVRWKDSQGGNYSKLFHDSSFIPVKFCLQGAASTALAPPPSCTNQRYSDPYSLLL